MKLFVKEHGMRVRKKVLGKCRMESVINSYLSSTLMMDCVMIRIIINLDRLSMVLTENPSISIFWLNISCLPYFLLHFPMITSCIQSMLFFFGADAPVGRFSMQSLTDRMRMDLCIENLHFLAQRTLRRGEQFDDDVCMWLGFKCDGQGHVVEIQLQLRTRQGAIRLEYLPENLKKIQASYNKWHGTLDAARLPAELEHFAVFHNFLSGTVTFAALPKNLRVLNLYNNEFHGECALHALPPNLEYIHVGCNNFTGSLNLTSLPSTLESAFFFSNQLLGSVSLSFLPKGLKMLNIRENKLEGEISFDNLPDGLEDLFMENNFFCGPFILMDPPMELLRLAAGRNRFSGIAVIHKSKARGGIIDLTGNKISSFVDTDYREHHAALFLD